MQLELEEVLKGKPTIIKGKTFYGTENYVQPFVDKMSKFTDDFRVHVQLPDQITIGASGNDNTYNRVLVEAVMPDDAMYENHDKVVAMEYGIDVRKPVCKFYSGALNSACTNLCVFNPSHLSIQEMQEGTPIDFRHLDRIIELQDETNEILTRMAGHAYMNDVETREQLLGRWIDNAILMQYPNEWQKVKIGTDTVIRAYKDLFIDEQSDYFVGGETINDFQIYNAFTQQLTNERDKGKVLTLPEKTILVSNILSLN